VVDTAASVPHPAQAFLYRCHLFSPKHSGPGPLGKSPVSASAESHPADSAPA
jgi:hypothetical protein